MPEPTDKTHQSSGRGVRLRSFSLVIVVVLAAGLIHFSPVAQGPVPLKVGILDYMTIPEKHVQGFKDGMTEQGFVEGKDIVYVYIGPSNTPDELDANARELVNGNPDIILAITSTAAGATKEATRDNPIPIVFTLATDPVGSGLVSEIARPGANLTGIACKGEGDLPQVRRFEWLVNLSDAEKVYVLYDPEDPVGAGSYTLMQRAAEHLGVELIPGPASDGREALAVGRSIPEQADAVFLTKSLTFYSQGILGEIISTSNNMGLPLSAESPETVRMGGLVSCGEDLYLTGKQAARLAGQILRGGDPAVLPVESPRLLLAVNLKTASNIGVNLTDETLKIMDIIVR